MTDIDTVDERLRAVERAVADGDADADLAAPAGEIADRVDDLDETVAELEAGLQAVRGYVGEVRSTDDEIESRADAALAAVEKLEERIDRLERARDGRTTDGAADPAGGDTDPESRSADGAARRRRERTGTDERPSPTRRRSPSDPRSDRATGPVSGAQDGRGTPDTTRAPGEIERRGPREPDRCPHCTSRSSDRDRSRVAADPGAGSVSGPAAAGPAGRATPDDREDHDDVDEQGLIARLRAAL